MRRTMLSAFACVAITLVSTQLVAALPSAEEVFHRPGIRHGVYVVVGPHADLAIDLARAQPILVFVLAPKTSEPDVRSTLVKAGVHGQVTVAAFDGQGRLPLTDNLAAALIADLDSHPKLANDELLRVLRPGGQLCCQKRGQLLVSHKPRPDGVDDWTQYFHDGAASDLSSDLHAGPAHGLQWQAGPHNSTKIGVRVIGDLWLGVDAEGLVCRDAYSGLPKWRRREVQIDNRYTFLVDDQRVYYHPSKSGWSVTPPHMIVLDLRTGEELSKLTEGVALDAEGWRHGQHDYGSFKKEFPSDWKERLRSAERKAQTLQARLADGVLVQVCLGQMVALDAKTGKRLWELSADGTNRWHHPVIHEGRVYAIEGPAAPSWSYTHWPMGAVRSIVAADLKSGARLWKWDWPASAGNGMAAYNMIVSDRWLTMVMRQDPGGKSPVALLLVDRETGGEHRLLTETPYGKGSIGGGHSHIRVLRAGNRLWLNAIQQCGATDPADPADQEKWLLNYRTVPRPVGCTVWRATPNWLFGSLSTYALDGSQIWHTNVTRTACDVGAFPAAGMSYITPNHCFCQPYQPGFNAFHPRRFAGIEEIPRLDRSATEPASNSTSEGWTTYLGDNRRSAWSDTKIPTKLQMKWSVKPDVPTAPERLATQWGGNWYTQGPLTAVSVTDNIAVMGVVDRQQVLALNATSGKELWRTTVDGRIDTNPTIRSGLVYVGTRTGWVYALNLDSGDMVWRFFAAPRRERVVAFGQLESPWPLHGCVLVDDDGVWAIAGRHNDLDGGLWWWNLDPLTGEARSNGRLGRDDLRSTTGGGGATGSKDGTVPNGSTTPAVSDGEVVLLAGVWLRKESGKLVIWDGLKSSGEHERWTVRFPLDVVVPGNQGLLCPIDALSGYKMSYYGLTQAPLYAYNGNEFINVWGTTTIQHRGGSRDRNATVRLFRKYDTINQVKHPTDERRTIRVGSEVLWETPCRDADKAGVKAIAVAGDSVLIGLSVDNRDFWRARDEMAYRLRVLNLADGKPRQDDLRLPEAPVRGGISAAGGLVYVVSSDGTVTCFGG